MEHQMKRTGHLLVAGSALSGAVALVARCRGGTQAQAQMAPPPPAVSVAAVEERKITEWDEFIGRLEAVESVEIRPRVSGYIERVYFTAGKEVRKGDLLFQIDPRPYKADLARAQAELLQARSAAGLSARSLQRSKQLAAGDAISREELDNRSGAAERNAAAVSVPDAPVATARLHLDGPP